CARSTTSEGVSECPDELTSVDDGLWEEARFSIDVSRAGEVDKERGEFIAVREVGESARHRKACFQGTGLPEYPGSGRVIAASLRFEPDSRDQFPRSLELQERLDVPRPPIDLQFLEAVDVLKDSKPYGDGVRARGEGPRIPARARRLVQGVAVRQR